MIIVIDAYNYIKSITGNQFTDDRASQQWIDIFKEYSRVRHNQVILVFDAGPSYYPFTQRHGGVVVSYSGNKRTADDAIKDWLKDHAGADALLVSSDRELCHFASDLGVASVGSYDFYIIFNHIMKQSVMPNFTSSDRIHKYDQSSMKTRSGLDDLMEEGSRGLSRSNGHKALDITLGRLSSQKISRLDKQMMRKIDKI